MPANDYSRDLWDYLNEIEHMPSRNDRDRLVKKIDEDPREAKRLDIWNYFFRLRPEDIGKPQMREIALRKLQRTQELNANKAQALRMLWLAFLPIIVGTIATPVFAQRGDQYVQLIGPGIIALGVAVLILIATTFFQKRDRIQVEYQEIIDGLDKSIEALRRKIPKPPDAEQVRRWLQDDLNGLADHALEKTGLGERRLELADGENPIRILGPALLQSREIIPRLFLNKDAKDLGKHLWVFQPAFLPGAMFGDFYGVYYIEFIIVANDMLGNYGCFFDFITNDIYLEHTSEIYYKDVVSLSTRDELRQINVDWLLAKTVKATTFGMSLASGEEIKVSFQTADYVSNLIAQPPDQVQIKDRAWIWNPGPYAEQAMKALRYYLRKHKGILDTGDAA